MSTCDPTTPTPTPIFTPGEREGKGRSRELGAECGKEDGDGKRKREEVDEMIGRMLADIERVKGWRGVQRVLSGGRVCEFFSSLPAFLFFFCALGKFRSASSEFESELALIFLFSWVFVGFGSARRRRR